MNAAPTEQQLRELVAGLSECDDLNTFYDWVYYIVHNNCSEVAFRNAHVPSQDECIIISDDDEPRPVASSVRKGKSKMPRPSQAQDDVIMLD